MMKPTIHLNGTSCERLLDGYVAACQAVRQAMDALAEHATPNGRDYYPQGEGAIRYASREHDERMNRLAGVLIELEKLAEHCAEVGQ